MGCCQTKHNPETKALLDECIRGGFGKVSVDQSEVDKIISDTKGIISLEKRLENLKLT